MRHALMMILAGVMAGLAGAAIVVILLALATPLRANAGLYERHLLEKVHDLLRWDLCSRANAGWGFKKGRGGTSEEWWHAVQKRFECHKLLDEDLQ